MGTKLNLKLQLRQAFSWLFDTGAGTCMIVSSFHTALSDTKPRKSKDSQDCVAASGDKNEFVRNL